MSESINMVMIENLKELMEDDFSLLLETYITDGDQSLLDLDKALNDNNAMKISKITHTLKGSSSNLGADALAKTSYKIETIARNADLAGIEDVVVQLKKEYQEVRDYFQGLL